MATPNGWDVCSMICLRSRPSKSLHSMRSSSASAQNSSFVLVKWIGNSEIQKFALKVTEIYKTYLKSTQSPVGKPKLEFAMIFRPDPSRKHRSMCCGLPQSEKNRYPRAGCMASDRGSFIFLPTTTLREDPSSRDTSIKWVNESDQYKLFAIQSTTSPLTVCMLVVMMSSVLLVLIMSTLRMTCDPTSA